MSANACDHYSIDSFYIFFMSLDIVLSSSAFLLNSALLYAIIQSKLLPKSVTFLLGNLTFALLISVVPVMIRNVRFVAILKNNGSLVPVGPYHCSMSAIEIIIGVVAMVSMGSLGLERWMMTKKLQNNSFEKNGNHFDKKSNIVVAVAFGTWILAAGSTAFTLNTRVYQSVTSAPNQLQSYYNGSTLSHALSNMTTSATDMYNWCVCPSRTSRNTVKTLVTATLYLILEVLVLCLYMKVWKVNKRKLAEFDINCQSHSLEIRFEIRQNIRTTLMMLPTVVTHGISWLAVIAIVYFQPLLMGKYSCDPLKKMKINLIKRCTFSICVFLHPISIFMKSKQLRRTLTFRQNTTIVAGLSTSASGTRLQNIKFQHNKAQKRAVEYRVKPEEGLQITEKIWGQKNRTNAVMKNCRVLPEESLVEIDQVWEAGVPKRHHTKRSTIKYGGVTTVGLSSFMAKIRPSGHASNKIGNKYEVKYGMPAID